MRVCTYLRPLRAVLLGAPAVALLAGCEAGQFGFSGRDAEWQRHRFAVVSASPERAVVSARGQQVAVEPSPGFCVAGDSIETSDSSAFVLIGDCVLENGAGVMPGADDTLDIPSGMPGIITVSISGDPGFGSRGASDTDLTELENYLKTPAGRQLLGRGGDHSQVSVVETRRDGTALFVLVEDRAAEAVPVLAPRFWRAFTELNDRLTVVTVSGFRDVPMDEAVMLRHLGDQVRQLQFANAAPIEEAPVQLAAAPSRQSGGPIAEAEPVQDRSDSVIVGAVPPPNDEWTQTALAETGREPVGALGAKGAVGNDRLALASAHAALPGASGQASAAHSVDGWGGIAAQGQSSEPDGSTAVDAKLQTEPEPVTIAPIEDGLPNSWPAPRSRPGDPGAHTNRAADASGASPMPMPRAGHEPAMQAGATAPLPPRRVSR